MFIHRFILNNDLSEIDVVNEISEKNFDKRLLFGFSLLQDLESGNFKSKEASSENI